MAAKRADALLELCDVDGQSVSKGVLRVVDELVRVEPTLGETVNWWKRSGRKLTPNSIAAVLANYGPHPGATVNLWVSGMADEERLRLMTGGVVRRPRRSRAAQRPQEATKPAQDAAKYAWWSVIVGAIAAAAGVVAVVLSAIPLLD
jgi:hypothetical protein